jgi:hypothetical protein
MAQKYPITELDRRLSPNEYCKVYKYGSCRVIVGQEPVGWHISISHHRRLPTWEEVREARYQFVPNEVTMAMMLPPKEHYVNIHEFCFQLYEVKDESKGDGPWTKL